MRITTIAALALPFVLVGAAHAQGSAPKYRLELIDQFASNVLVSQLYVNESGLVAAFGSNSTVGRQSIRWSAPGQFVTTPTSLGLVPRWLTNTGRLVGASNPPNGGVISVALDGSFTQIAPPGGVGQYQTVAAVAPNGDYVGTDDFGGQHGYRVRGGAYSNLLLDPSYSTFGRFAGMNDAGVVAGTYLDPSGGPGAYRTWVARGGISTTLPQTVNGTGGSTLALDVDSTGRVLGTFENGAGLRTVIWGADDVPTLVNPPAGFFLSNPVRFNASGTVIADYASTTGLQAGFTGITTPTGTYRWENLIEGGTAGMQIQNLSDISDSGYIVGNLTMNGVNRAFRMTPLTPVPEPATLAALGLGAAALLRRRKRNGSGA